MFTKQNGAAVLIITIILLTVALLGMVYEASEGAFQQKTASNQYGNTQAFEAAQGGLEYGLVYLNANSSTILASPVGGYINYGSSDTNLTNVSLANNSKYSVVYTNPTQSKYSILNIKSTGSNADGTASRTIQEDVDSTSSITYAATTLGNFTASGSGKITGGTNAVDAGGTVNTAGWSNSGTITQNDSSMSGLTGAELFQNLFNMTYAQMESQSTVYSNSGSVPWSSLSGNVWFNNNLTLSGNYTVATTADPVLLVVNGNVVVSGNFTVNGVLFVAGTVTTSGSFNINGALVAVGAITASGNLTFNETIVKQVTGNSSYVIVPGSWKDF